MNKEMIKKMGALAEEVIKKAMASGLSWDESIAALGVATKAMSVKAAAENHGSQSECLAHAKKRFQEGIDQTVLVLKTYMH